MSPQGSITLTDRDRSLIEVLSTRVRVLSLDQVTERFWAGSSQAARSARDRMAKLEAAGLIALAERMTRPTIELSEPLLVWRPHRPTPDLTAVVRTLASRWADEIVRTLCVTVAPEGSRGIAGLAAATPPADAEVTHDLHVAAVYFRMLDELPARASTWTLETHLPKGQGVKVPDAMVRDGLDRTAIEFGGLYDRPKLESFHRYCHEQGMGYELW